VFITTLNVSQNLSLILGFIRLLLELYVAILQEEKVFSEYREFYKVMQLATQESNWLSLNMTNLVSFSILRYMCSPIRMSIKLYGFVP